MCARCLTWWPLAGHVQGVSGYVAVYDLQSNTRIGRVDLKALPVEMAFAPDGTVLIVATQVRPGANGVRVQHGPWGWRGGAGRRAAKSRGDA